MTIRGLDQHITGNYGEDQLRHACPRCGAICGCDGQGDGATCDCSHPISGHEFDATGNFSSGDSDFAAYDGPCTNDYCECIAPFVCAHKCPPERTWDDVLCPECQSSPCACDRGL